VQRHDAMQVLVVHVDVFAVVLHPLQAVTLREGLKGFSPKNLERKNMEGRSKHKRLITRT